jgi:hypothetical protein
VTGVEELFPLDDDVERLLSGASAAPAGVRRAPGPLDGLVPLVAAVRRPATADEEAGEAGAIELFRTVRSAGARSRPSRRALAIRVVAVAGALTVASSTAAAASGALPEPVQDTAAAILAKVGIDVPTPDDSSPPPIVPSTVPGGSEPERVESQPAATLAPAPPSEALVADDAGAPALVTTAVADAVEEPPPSPPEQSTAADDSHGGATGRRGHEEPHDDDAASGLDQPGEDQGRDAPASDEAKANPKPDKGSRHDPPGRSGNASEHNKPAQPGKSAKEG